VVKSSEKNFRGGGGGGSSCREEKGKIALGGKEEKGQGRAEGQCYSFTYVTGRRSGKSGWERGHALVQVGE